MTRGTAAAAAVVLAIALAVAGCGGSGSASSADAKLSKAEFIKEGNAICKRGSDQIFVAFGEFTKTHGIDEGGSLTRPQEEEFVTEAVVPSIQEQADDLAELGAPEGDQGQTKAIVDGLEEMVAAGKKDPANLLTVSKTKGPVAEVNLTAKRYGVDECTQP